uniref:F-box domain-containing protein n=1 Tax=Panagrellus redivivus TaxID=6233 RepID=A0A7E5A204_PANRE
MASLKSDLLREVAEILCLSDDENQWDSPRGTFSFLLSGKEPSVIVRRMIEDEIINVDENWFPNYDKYDIKIRYRSFTVPRFFNMLLLKWARKLEYHAPHVCVLTLPRTGLIKVLCENKDLRELTVTPSSIITWAEAFKLFPKLVSLNLSPLQFEQALLNAPNALTGLEEIDFNFTRRPKHPKISLADACVALSTHHAKYPSLKVVHFKGLELRKVQYPDASKIIAVPSVEHFKLDIDDKYKSFDFNFLTTVQKMFPSLETLDMHVKADYYEQDMDPDEFDQFYQAFRSLRLGFCITINSCKELFRFEKDGTEVRERFAPQPRHYRDIPRMVFFNVLCENNDIRKLSIDESIFDDWAEGFKMFSNVVSMHSTPLQFKTLLLNAPNAPTSLQEISFSLDCIRQGGLPYACVLLGKHQAKYPALEVVHFNDRAFDGMQYPDASKLIPMPSVKHFKMVAILYWSFDFGILTTIQKLFPSLETMDMVVKIDLSEKNRDLEEQLYETFHSLSLGFSIKIKCRHTLSCSETYATEFCEYLATKGTVIQNEGLVIAETRLPGKTLIREVKISIYIPNPRDQEFCCGYGCCEGADSYSDSD